MIKFLTEYIPEKGHYTITEYDTIKHGMRCIGKSLLLYNSTLSCNNTCLHDTLEKALKDVTRDGMSTTPVIYNGENINHSRPRRFGWIGSVQVEFI